MEIQEYFEPKKEFYDDLLVFLENDCEDLQNFVEKIVEYNITKSKQDLEHFLLLITSISNNHHRSPNFFDKIEGIINSVNSNFKQIFTNSEIFDIFGSNKRLLIFLLEKQILKFDKYVYHKIKKDFNFFLPEIREYKASKQKDTTEIDQQLKLYDNYSQKRTIGENDSYICSLIRQDLLNEFVSFVTTANISLTNRIQQSIFETNCFLYDREPTLIEYAAFFGSIHIVQYLHFNNIALTPSLWMCATHSNNPNMIQFIESNKVNPPNDSYELCRNEAIKCHHNSIAQYFIDNFISDRKKNSMFDKDIIDCSFRYFNYSFFPENFDTSLIFEYLLQYNFTEAVDIYIDVKMDDLEAIIIRKTIFFNGIQKLNYIKFRIQIIK